MEITPTASAIAGTVVSMAMRPPPTGHGNRHRIDVGHAGGGYNDKNSARIRVGAWMCVFHSFDAKTAGAAAQG